MRLKMPNGSVLEYRVDADGAAFWRWDASDVPGHWLKIGSPERSALVVELLKMESRANEYHDTTMQQAKRIAEMEAELGRGGGGDPTTEEYTVTYDKTTHPDPLIAAECEIERLQGLLCEARGGLFRVLDLPLGTPPGLAVKRDVRTALERTGGLHP